MMRITNWTATVHREVLANGLVVLIQPVRSSGVVTVVTQVTAGYFDEPDDAVGISHVLEHMYFKGTPSRGPGRLAQDVKQLGGQVNAVTAYDKTVYYITLPSSPTNLDLALAIGADAIRRPLLDPGELERELEVIVQEAKRKTDNPSAVAVESLYALLFDHHPIRRWRIGTAQGLRALSSESVRAYHATRYRPDNVVLAVVGDLGVEHAVECVQRAFGDWHASGIPVMVPPAESGVARSRFDRRFGDIGACTTAMGWRTVARRHADAVPLEFAAALLSRGRGSRLYRSVRQPGLASTAVASHYSPGNVGVFDLFVQCDPDRLARGLETALATVGELSANPCSESEISRVRALLEVSLARRIEASQGRAILLAEYETLGGYALVEEYQRRLLSVTREQATDVVRRYLSAAPCVFEFLPDGVEPVVPTPGIGLPGPAPASGPPLEPLGGGSRARVDAAAGVVRGEEDGMPILALPRPGAGFASVSVVFPWSALTVPRSQAGIAVLIARSAVRGAAGIAADELAVRAEHLGGSVRPLTTSEYIGWSISVLPDKVQAAVALLDNIARDAAFAPSEVLAERHLQVADARRARDDMLGYPISRVLEVGLPDSSLAYPPLGDPELVSAIEPESVNHRAGQLLNVRPIWIVAADDAGEALVEMVAQCASTGGQPAGSPAGSPVWAAGHVGEQRRKEQTALALAVPAFAYASPQRRPAQVLCAALGGLGGRLFERLRGQLSLAYTVSAFAWLRSTTGAIVFYIATSPDREEEARAELLAELVKVGREGISQEETVRAREYVAGLELLRRETGAGAAGAALTGELYGTLEELADEPDALRRVSIDEVAQVAADVLQFDDRAEFVLRGGN